MDISFISSAKNDLLVIVGSNGLIGNKILENYEIRNNEFNCFSKKITNYDLIFESILNFLKTKKGIKFDRFYLIFCAGKGGFSLDSKSASTQKSIFKKFVIRVYEENFENFKFFFISSLGCYLSQFKTPYKQLMNTNEDFILSFRDSYILRLPSIWGFKKKAKQPKGLIGNLIFSIKNQSESKIFGDLNTSRNYISDNTIGIYLYRFLQNKEFFSREYNFYNYCSYSINDILLLIKKITKKNVFYKKHPGKIEDKESYNMSPKSGVNIKVIESIHMEIYKLWMSL